jgi:hypothetical protein
MEQIMVRVVSSTKAETQGDFSFDEDAVGDATLMFKLAEETFSATASDFFEAMCQIRRQLELLGWRPVCYGRSKNVYPSGMCRDMGRGLKAYKFSLGRPGSIKDLVSIFDTGEDIEPASVDEQRSFAMEWFKSIGLAR